MSNGQDLDGEYAFDKVIDLLLEATKKNGGNAGELAEARHQTSIAQSTVDTLKQQVAVLQSDLKAYQNADDAFGALYTAANMSAKIMSDTGNKEYADVLIEKVAAAKKFIDPIPF